jgi:hypothetical protein
LPKAKSTYVGERKQIFNPEGSSLTAWPKGPLVKQPFPCLLVKTAALCSPKGVRAGAYVVSRGNRYKKSLLS